MDALKVFLSGVVIIGLVTAVGLHGKSISTAAQGSGKAGASLLTAAEKPA